MKAANITIFLLPFVLAAILTFFISFQGIVMLLSYFIILGMILSIFVFIDFLKLYWHSRRYKVCLSSGELPKYKIAVVVTTFNEDPSMVLDTALSAKLAAGENGDVFVLDDSTDEETRRRINQFESYGLKIVRRDSRRGYKAGAINDWLKVYGDKYELLAIFDADQRPLPFIFNIVWQYFVDEKTAFVQIPQYYSDITSGVSLGAFYQQLPFLRLVMKGRNRANSAFSLGSGTVYRVRYLRDIGGLDDSTVTEDISTALDLHSKGLRSAYIDKPLIWFGMPPKNIAGYWVQQGRWSLGGFQLLSKLLRANLNADQFFDYFNGWLYWFIVGPITVFELIAPQIFLLFGIYFFRWDPVIYLSAYIPYFLASLVLYLFMVKEHSYGFRGFVYHHTVQLLAFISVSFSFAGWLLKKKKPFAVTPKGETSRTPPRILVTFAAITVLLLLSTIKGIFDLVNANPIAQAAYLINIFWAAYFAAFFAFGLIVILRKRTFSDKIKLRLKPWYLVEHKKEDVLSLIHGAIQLEDVIAEIYLALAQRLGEERSSILKQISVESKMHAGMLRRILSSLNYVDVTTECQGSIKDYLTVLKSYKSYIAQDLDDEKIVNILQLLLETERYINEEEYVALLNKIFEETLVKPSGRVEESKVILKSITNDEKKHIEMITMLRDRVMLKK